MVVIKSKLIFMKYNTNQQHLVIVLECELQIVLIIVITNNITPAFYVLLHEITDAPLKTPSFLHDQQEPTAEVLQTNVTYQFVPHVIYSL